MATYNNEANGFYDTINGTGVVLDCDSHDNIGPTSTSAGNTDGFGAHAKNVWYIGDRSWHNSDDGYDSINSKSGPAAAPVPGRVAYVNSWAFGMHGNKSGAGDQKGFKVGGFAYATTGIPCPLPLQWSSGIFPQTTVPAISTRTTSRASRPTGSATPATFQNALAAQAGKHVSPYAAETLTLVATALGDASASAGEAMSSLWPVAGRTRTGQTSSRTLTGRDPGSVRQGPV